MTRLICILCFFIHFNTDAQQRIGVDLSTRLDNLILTVHFQKVLKNRFLYSAGLFVGGNGRVFFNNNSSDLYSGKTITTPFSNANEPIIDSTGTYSILDYNYSSKSVGVQFGLGYFFEFDTQHGLRTNLNTSFGFAQSTLGGFYRSLENNQEVYAKHNNNHIFGSISLESYHTIRLSGRITVYYGLKVPYFFTLDRKRFSPLSKKDLLNGFEPQISLGFTRVIGKCD